MEININITIRSICINKLFKFWKKPDFNKNKNKGGKNMKTKTLKRLTFVATILLLISMCASTVLAVTPSSITVQGDETNGVSEVMNIGNQILTVINAVGVVLAVIILVILGIKYMMGSAEEKAEYKKTMVPYIIGAVFIFAAPTIANVVYKLATGINSTTP